MRHLLPLLFLLGCANPAVVESTLDADLPDSGLLEDASVSIDAGTPDSNVVDAGKPDSGTTDAGSTPDAGASADGGVGSSTPTDAGVDSGASQRLFVCVMPYGAVGANSRRDCSPVSRVAYYAAWTPYPPFDLTLANQLKDAMAAGDYAGYTLSLVTTNSPKYVGVSTYTVNSSGQGTLVVETVCVYSTATAYALANGLCVEAL